MSDTLIECDLCGRTEVQPVARLVTSSPGVEFLLCETCYQKPDAPALVDDLARMYVGVHPDKYGDGD